MSGKKPDHATKPAENLLDKTLQDINGGNGGAMGPIDGEIEKEKLLRQGIDIDLTSNAKKRVFETPRKLEK